MKEGLKARVRAVVPPYVVWLIGAFAIATACFVGSALYADSQFATVVHRSHEVSENALPSLFRLGVMRRETSDIFFLLDENADGDRSAGAKLARHWADLDEAVRAYEKLPQFPGEAALWRATQQDIERMRAAGKVVDDLVTRHHMQEAMEAQQADVEPAAQDVDRGLSTLFHMNSELGTRAAQEADALWLRARRFSLALSGVNVVLTAALAFSAIRYARRYETVQRERADEFEAFAGRVAHDLRGPLSPATLAIQSVQRTLDENDPRRKTLERGRRSLFSLEALIADLLAFARSGAKPDLAASSSLQEVAATVAQDLEPEARDEGVRILLDELPTCSIRCSQGVLSSILFNLVGNSLKYMRPDVAEKVVCLRGARKNRHLVRVEVADSGHGLPEGDPRRLFEPYVRGSRAKSGLGLGLATVRRLVEAHGGSVGARTNDGTGAVFWFEMPVK